MSNSSLVTYTNISPFRNSPRNQPITKITWHHCAGVISLEAFDKIVHTPGRDMSANYCIDKDARVGLFCPEGDRSWCSSSSWNDNRSVTIEISNSSVGEPWPISDKVFNKAIELTVDICKRNGIKELTFTGDKNGSLTFHYMFAATGCPGTYIKNKAQEICRLVNSRLNQNNNTTTTTSSSTTSFKTGQLVSISNSAVYYSGSSIPNWVKSQKWYISSISGDRAVLGKNEKGDQNIQSPINTKYLTLVTTRPVSSTFKSYTVSLKSTTRIFKEPGVTVPLGTVGAQGTYTIVDEKTINGVKYGKLKSGVGWVKINNSNDTTIRVGDKVKVLKNVQFNNKPFKVYCSSYTVLEIKNNRVVISSDGKNVTCAINITNIEKI